jgi:hypothetical protein
MFCGRVKRGWKPLHAGPVMFPNCLFSRSTPRTVCPWSEHQLPVLAAGEGGGSFTLRTPCWATTRTHGQSPLTQSAIGPRKVHLASPGHSGQAGRRGWDSKGTEFVSQRRPAVPFRGSCSPSLMTEREKVRSRHENRAYRPPGLQRDTTAASPGPWRHNPGAPLSGRETRRMPRESPAPHRAGRGDGCLSDRDSRHDGGASPPEDVLTRSKRRYAVAARSTASVPAGPHAKPPGVACRGPVAETARSVPWPQRPPPGSSMLEDFLS